MDARTKREIRRATVRLREKFGATELSRMLASADVIITPQAISLWKMVPVERVLAIEKATGTPRHEMRPDIYPEPMSSEEGHISSEVVASNIDAVRPNQVRIAGYVGAGSQAHFYALAHDSFEIVDAPEGATANTVAVEIKGTSLGVLWEGWLVFYDDVRAPVTADQYGKLCVVGLADGRILVKKIKRQPDGSIALFSSDPPIVNADVEWAAVVIQLRPR